MTGQNPGPRDAVNAAAGALGQTPRSGPRPPSTARKVARVAGNVVYHGLNAANKAMSVVLYLSELVAGNSPTTGPRPQAYQPPRRTGAEHGDELGHAAPEVAQTSPLAMGHGPTGHGPTMGGPTGHGPTMGGPGR